MNRLNRILSTIAAVVLSPLLSLPPIVEESNIHYGAQTSLSDSKNQSNKSQDYKGDAS